MVETYAREHTVPQARVRRLISSLALIGPLQRITDERDDPRFLVKGGVAMELRLGVEARSTQDFDVVFRGAPADLCDALDEAFVEPYSGFELTRHGESTYIGQTSTQRQTIKLTFNGRAWQTLTMEIARPEGSKGGDPEIVPAAMSEHPPGQPAEVPWTLDYARHAAKDIARSIHPCDGAFSPHSGSSPPTPAAVNCASSSGMRDLACAYRRRSCREARGARHLCRGSRTAH